MPKVKTEASWRKEKNGESSEKKSESNNNAAASDDNAMGFRNRAKAEQTITSLAGRDVAHQFKVIHTLTMRAKNILKRTKNEDKVRDITEAIEVFEDWLQDYRDKDRGKKEQLRYLPVEILNSYDELVRHHKLMDKCKPDGATRTFPDVYREVDGDQKQLRALKVGGTDDDLTWDVARNSALKELLKDESAGLFEKEGPLEGLPTAHHVQLIMWGYSPDPAKIKKEAGNIHWKLEKAK